MSWVQAQDKPAKPAEEKKKEAAAPPGEKASPSEVFRTRIKAGKKGDSAALLQCYVQYPGAASEVTEWLTYWELKGPFHVDHDKAWDTGVAEEKVMGDGAVVIRSDLAPAYLLRQDGQWRLFPNPVEWDMRKFPCGKRWPVLVNLTEEQRKNFTALEAWYDERKAAIKAEQKAAAKPDTKPPKP
jgi:hypothetical protein